MVLLLRTYLYFFLKLSFPSWAFRKGVLSVRTGTFPLLRLSGRAISPSWEWEAFLSTLHAPSRDQVDSTGTVLFPDRVFLSRDGSVSPDCPRVSGGRFPSRRSLLSCGRTLYAPWFFVKRIPGTFTWVCRFVGYFIISIINYKLIASFWKRWYDSLRIQKGNNHHVQP